MKRALVILSCCLAAWASAPALADGLLWRKAEEGESLILSFDVTQQLATPLVRNRLKSGLRNRLLISLGLRASGRDYNLFEKSWLMEITYDLWDEIYLVSIQSEGERASFREPSLDQVLQRVSRYPRVPAGLRRELAKAGEVNPVVIVSFNPVNEDLVRKTREYLVNPTGHRNSAGRQTFFGSFAGLFLGGGRADGDFFIRLEGARFRVSPPPPPDSATGTTVNQP
ncbi:MAG: hypothetical protein GMKNLPBB_01242 [Myxococcota bacterium]|nr:hypothetical protein [Myxococcota bacterium]